MWWKSSHQHPASTVSLWARKFLKLRITAERNSCVLKITFKLWHTASIVLPTYYHEDAESGASRTDRFSLLLFSDSLYKVAFVCTSGNTIHREARWEKFPNHIQRHTGLQILFISQESLVSSFSGWGHIPSAHFNEIWLFNRISQHASCSVGKYCANVSHFHSLVLVSDSHFAFYLSSL